MRPLRSRVGPDRAGFVWTSRSSAVPRPTSPKATGRTDARSMPTAPVLFYRGPVCPLSLALDDGADPAAVTATMQGHVLAEAEVVGTYRRR